jgi:glycosyltransferase involved in cell wall biosynthesis
VSKPLKIQIVSWRDPKNPKAGGAEVCLTEIANRLNRQFGHSFSWFAPKFEGGLDQDKADHIQIERYGFFGAIHLSAFLRFFPKWSQTADFYIEDYHGVSLGISTYLSKPSLILVHEVAGPIWKEMWKFPLSTIGYYLEKIVLYFLKDSHFIAVSESTKRDLVAHGISPLNISRISEGSNLTPVDKPWPRKERKDQFVFVGRICKMKRVDLVLGAFAELRTYYPDSKLVLAGSMDPDFKQEYEFLISSLKLSNNVVLAGFVTVQEKAKLLQESVALVSGSMHEGFGLIVVEANSQGTPAVTFNVPGYRDLIENGKNGYMVEYPDIKALAGRMRELLGMDLERFRELCSSSLEISKKYSWDQSAADFNAIISKVCEQWKLKSNPSSQKAD